MPNSRKRSKGVEGMEIDAQDAPSETGGEGPLAAALTEAQALAEERYKELQYARAEIDNVRKRAERIAADRLSAGRRALLAKFLPVIDNLKRAMEFEDSDSLRDGLQATLKGFDALLAAEGARPIEVVGKPFDPRLAEAIESRQDADVPDDQVLEEIRRGYTLGEDLLRPAQVVVSKRAQDKSA
ncbi:MAG TPA: nucleotide exchange factor GrpE [Candidatus Baltobacteraceae bacterium]|nr:nucleotide exchange factor GrpE [Candidatus Baltobacteraceae bacterium]